MSTLRDCQLVQLRLLHAVDDLCRKHGIKYFLHGGTLLGAMRHNGFIPWDDDLDIGMPMKDYRRFLKIAEKELPHGMWLQASRKCPHLAIPFAKVRDVNSYYYDKEPFTWLTDPSGIYIDVFAFEKMPKMPLALQRFCARAISNPWMRQRQLLALACDHVWCSPLLGLAAIVCCVLHKILRIVFGLIRLVLPCEDYFLELEKCDPCPFKIKWFEPFGKHVFEDAEFPIPRDADSCLRASYGDWHWIPPPEKRPQHARLIQIRKV